MDPLLKALLCLVGACFFLIVAILIGRTMFTDKAMSHQRRYELEDAIESLIAFGFSPQDSARRVLEAHKNAPDADVGKIVNIALRL